MKLSTSLTVVLDTVKSFFVHGWQFRKIRYWDACYFFRALEILFGNMEKSFRYSVSQKYHYVGIEKDIKTLMICKNLAKRLADEDYKNFYSERCKAQIKEKWAHLFLEKDEGTSTGFLESKGTNFIMLDHKAEQNQIKADLELLCKLIKTRVSKMWW